MNVAVYTQNPTMAASLGAVFAQGAGVTVVESTSSPDIIHKVLLEGQIDVVVTGLVSVADFSEVCARLPEERSNAFKKVLTVVVMNKEVIRAAADGGFDAIIDIHNSPEAIAQQMKNIVRNVDIKGGGPDIDPDERLDVFPDFFVNRDQHDQMIVELVARGMTDKQVADSVGLAPQTVRNRLSRMLTDSGSQNRTHLAVRFLRERERHIRDS